MGTCTRGDGTNIGLRHPPGPTVALPTLIDNISAADVSFVSVSCGSRHSAAVSEDGVLYCWGWDAYRQVESVGGVQSVYCGH